MYCMACGLKFINDELQARGILQLEIIFLFYFPSFLRSRISLRKLPEFDEVLKFSGWNKELTMPSPEKKFIFIALPSGGGSDSTCVHSGCDLDLPFGKTLAVRLE